MPLNSSTPNSVRQTSQRRKSTGKRLRFEIFKRDGFACQYCGAQPPDVVLVVDHILPVAAGGDNDPLNLITACEPCNQGKADKTLGDRIVRPDADMLYLETQQETAEIQRYQKALDEKESALHEYVTRLQEVWCDWSGLDWHPNGHVVRGLLAKHEHDIVEQAIRDVAAKVGGGYISDSDSKWLPYLHAVARNMAADMEAE